MRVCASSGACPSAAAAAARSAAAAGAGCPVSSSAWACRHHAYPVRCGQPGTCQLGDLKGAVQRRDRGLGAPLDEQDEEDGVVKQRLGVIG
jgi:hypothetical protein